MTLNSRTYFEHLKAYVNDRYVVHDGNGGELIVCRQYFLETTKRHKIRKISLLQDLIQ